MHHDRDKNTTRNLLDEGNDILNRWAVSLILAPSDVLREKKLKDILTSNKDLFVCYLFLEQFNLACSVTSITQLYKDMKTWITEYFFLKISLESMRGIYTYKFNNFLIVRK